MKSLAPPAREQQEMREKKTRADRPTEARRHRPSRLIHATPPTSFPPLSISLAPARRRPSPMRSLLSSINCCACSKPRTSCRRSARLSRRLCCVVYACLRFVVLSLSYAFMLSHACSCRVGGCAVLWTHACGLLCYLMLSHASSCRVATQASESDAAHSGAWLNMRYECTLGSTFRRLVLFTHCSLM